MKNPRGFYNDTEMVVLLLYKLGVIQLDMLHEASNALHRSKNTMRQLLDMGGF